MNWILPILERYERPLLLYASSLCRDGDAARDIVQETFLKLARHGEPDPIAPWLFTVCRNAAIDLLRRRGRLIPMDHEPLEAVSDAPSPDRSLETREQTRHLAHLLQSLPENQREVIRLRFQCDLSYREIADVTRLSVSNVGFLIHTGLKKLRQLWPQSLEVNHDEH